MKPLMMTSCAFSVLTLLYILLFIITSYVKLWCDSVSIVKHFKTPLNNRGESLLVITCTLLSPAPHVAFLQPDSEKVPERTTVSHLALKSIYLLHWSTWACNSHLYTLRGTRKSVVFPPVSDALSASWFTVSRTLSRALFSTGLSWFVIKMLCTVAQPVGGEGPS